MKNKSKCSERAVTIIPAKHPGRKSEWKYVESETGKNTKRKERGAENGKMKAPRESWLLYNLARSCPCFSCSLVRAYNEVSARGGNSKEPQRLVCLPGSTTCVLLLLGGAFMTPSLCAQPSLSLPFPGQPGQHLPCASSRNENDHPLRLTLRKVGWETCTADVGIWGTHRGIFCNTAIFQWITLYTVQCILILGFWGNKMFGIVNIQETLIEFALDKAPHLPQVKRIAKIASLPSGSPKL